MLEQYLFNIINVFCHYLLVTINLMTNSLNGKTNNRFQLSGKPEKKNNNFILNKIQVLKVKILNDYLIPLYSKQWNILKENMFFIHDIQKKINNFNLNYKLPELAVYLDLLKIMIMFMDNYNFLQFQEENIGKHGTSGNSSNEFMNVFFQTAMIKLLPEYEIYNSILGKPKRELNQIYDQQIIEQIKKMLTQDNITFYKIKEYILKS